MASAAGGQQLQGGGRQIIMTQGGTPVRSGQILQVTGTGGQVQQIVVSQSGKIILCPQPHREIINAQRHILSRKKCLPKNDEKNVSKEKDDLETVIKTTPKQQANPNSRMKLKRRFSCKLCDKRSYAESHSLKEHERNIH